jgi:CheY-like chemotaxis protein
MAKRVLVVEDDAYVRDYLSAALETAGAGFEVVVASNGREAAERLVSGGADLVLTDLNMPEMNGVELVRHLRADHPEVQIVLMSGASADWLPELVREGLDDLPLLTKPVSVAQLLELVDRLLGR